MSSKPRTSPAHHERSASHPALLSIDPATKFLYQPHTVTALLIGLGLIVYYSRVFDPPGQPFSPMAAHQKSTYNTKCGIVAAALTFLAYSVLQGPAAPMVRPHPSVWRAVHGLAVLYLVALIFMLFQDARDARLLLKHIFPSLGVELPERAYGSDCRLVTSEGKVNWPTISATLFDEFVVAHTLGWWGKALIIRNYTLLWAISILFELMELTFQHMLPNFNECWWDSWVLDVALCNNIGILAGMATVKWYGSQTYDWRGISSQPTLSSKGRRAIMQFMPYSVDRFDWRVFSSPLRCLESCVPVILFLAVEVNAFFLKFVLWVPPLNPLNTLRLLLWLSLALPATKEYYQFMEAGRADFLKLGSFAWLAAAIALIETLLVVKFSRGMFPTPWPYKTVVVWTVALSVLAAALSVWSIKFYLIDKRHRQLKRE